MQPTPPGASNQALPPFWHALRPIWTALVAQTDILTATLGAFTGAWLFFFWPSDPTFPSLLLFPLAALLFGAATLHPTAYRLRPLGLFALMAALLWVLAFVQTGNRPVLPYAASAKHARWVVGPVASITQKEGKPTRSTVVLSPAKVYLGPQGAFTFQRAHIGVPTASVSQTQAGQGLAIPTVLLPPNGTLRPHGPNATFSRFFSSAYLAGYARGRVQPTALPPEFQPLSRFPVIEGWRTTLFDATQTKASGTMAALLMGSTRAIPPHVQAAYRQTGLTHLLAISGMQLTLVGVGVFFLIRWLLAWVPFVALRINTGFPAAGVGLVAAGAYAVLAGGGVTVLRALAMVALVLLAVLLGRKSQSLRAWGVAATGLLILTPSLALHAGLHLSLAAVFGLLLFSITRPQAHPGWGPQPPLWQRLFHTVQTLLSATLVAGAATAPVLVLHFGQVAPLSLLANAVAIPLMMLATYAGFAALLLWPLGLQALALWPMEALCTLATQWALWLAPLSPPQPLALTGWVWGAVLAGTLASSLAILLGVFTRKLWLTGTGLCLGFAVAWGAGALVPNPTLIVWNGGTTAWGLNPATYAYHLLWSPDAPRDLQDAQRANLPTTAPIVPVSTTPDLLSLPPAAEGTYAWALRRHGQWVVQPLACTRLWQKTGGDCP